MFSTFLFFVVMSIILNLFMPKKWSFAERFCVALVVSLIALYLIRGFR